MKINTRHQTTHMSITTNKHDLVCILPNDANFLTMFELSGCIVLFENMSKKRLEETQAYMRQMSGM